MNPKFSPKRLVLIDAHAVLHRAYHALPQFSNSRGEPTGGLYGLAAMLIKLITTFRPDYIAAAYDLPKPTFRHEAYKDYKAGRAKADDALISQMKRSREIFSAFNIPIYDKEGFEADDILGTIVEQLNAKRYPPAGGLNADIIIASGDMDTLQLVDDKRVQVFTLKKGINDTVLYDEEAVKKRYGFGPELLPDFKGLSGDPSDNIKGVVGIGEKTATALITAFGSIEEIYKKLKRDEAAFKKAGIKERVVELLKKGEEEAEFSKMLATIHRDVPISFQLPEKEWREAVQLEKILKLFQELEFRTLGARVRELLEKNGTRTEGEGEAESGAGGKEAPPSATTDGEAREFLFATHNPREVKELGIMLSLVDSNIANPTADEIFRFTEAKTPAEAREKLLTELKKKILRKSGATLKNRLFR